MKISLLLMLLFVHHLHASNIYVYFDPNQIEMSAKTFGPIKYSQTSTTYREYYYGNDKVPVFRVANLLTPQINCLLAKAKQDHDYLGLKNNAKIFFLDQKSITDNFYIKKADKSIGDNWVIIDPKNIVLKKHKNENNKYDYFIIINTNNEPFRYSIKKSIFTKFKLAITLAIESNKSIGINIKEMIKLKPDAEKCVNVINKINDDNECIICLDQAKNTVFEPCCHLCVCEKCAKELNICPLCRMDIINSIKVFH